MSTYTGSNYDKMGKKVCCGMKGLRLNSRRFSVQRLRTNFQFIFRVLRRWRNSYKNCLRMLRRTMVIRGGRRRKEAGLVRGGNSSCRFSSSVGAGDVSCRFSSSAGLVSGGDVSYRFSSSAVRTMNHSNSFCSEAIADCLEFIKRNSVSSVDDERNPMLKQN